jgi:hypothetical protein
MTDDDILTMAKRHQVLDPFDMRPRDEEVIAFARELLGAAAVEKGETVPVLLEMAEGDDGIPFEFFETEQEGRAYFERLDGPSP